jgi:hypothetical protein
MEVSARMEHSTDTDPEQDLERSGDELEERIERLDEHIGEARQEAEARSEDPDPVEDTAGDWEDTDDDSGGEDPEAFDDPENVEEDEEDEE